MYRRAPGYTLIELMVVVILIAIITALAIPQINHASRFNAMRTASEDIHGTLREARARAAQVGAAHRVYIDGGAGILRVDQANDGSCWSFDACNVAPPGYGGPNCGLFVVRLDETYYQRNKIGITKVQTGYPGKVVVHGAPVNVCVTPRGRWHLLTADCLGTFPANMNGPLQIAVARTDAPNPAMCVITPERSMPRTAFGSGCLP